MTSTTPRVEDMIRIWLFIRQDTVQIRGRHLALMLREATPKVTCQQIKEDGVRMTIGTLPGKKHCTVSLVMKRGRGGVGKSSGELAKESPSIVEDVAEGRGSDTDGKSESEQTAYGDEDSDEATEEEERFSSCQECQDTDPAEAGEYVLMLSGRFPFLLNSLCRVSRLRDTSESELPRKNSTKFRNNVNASLPEELDDHPFTCCFTGQYFVCVEACHHVDRCFNQLIKSVCDAARQLGTLEFGENEMIYIDDGRNGFWAIRDVHRLWDLRLLSIMFLQGTDFQAGTPNIALWTDLHSALNLWDAHYRDHPDAQRAVLLWKRLAHFTPHLWSRYFEGKSAKSFPLFMLLWQHARCVFRNTATETCKTILGAENVGMNQIGGHLLRYSDDLPEFDWDAELKNRNKKKEKRWQLKRNPNKWGDGDDSDDDNDLDDDGDNNEGETTSSDDEDGDPEGGNEGGGHREERGGDDGGRRDDNNDSGGFSGKDRDGSGDRQGRDNGGGGGGGGGGSGGGGDSGRDSQAKGKGREAENKNDGRGIKKAPTSGASKQRRSSRWSKCQHERKFIRDEQTIDLRVLGGIRLQNSINKIERERGTIIDYNDRFVVSEIVRDVLDNESIVPIPELEQPTRKAALRAMEKSFVDSWFKTELDQDESLAQPEHTAVESSSVSGQPRSSPNPQSKGAHGPLTAHDSGVSMREAPIVSRIPQPAKSHHSRGDCRMVIGGMYLLRVIGSSHHLGDSFQYALRRERLNIEKYREISWKFNMKWLCRSLDDFLLALGYGLTNMSKEKVKKAEYFRFKLGILMSMHGIAEGDGLFEVATQVVERLLDGERDQELQELASNLDPSHPEVIDMYSKLVKFFHGTDFIRTEEEEEEGLN